MGSIESLFKFKSYKVDYLEFHINQNVDLLEFVGVIDPEFWDYKIGIRKPLYIKSKNIYIGGVDCSLFLFPKDCKEKDKTTKNALIFLEGGILGSFGVREERFEPEIENNLVRKQIPAILFPYLRATISSLLANAGFGSVNIPLINIHKFAEDSLKDIKVEIVE